MVGNFVSCRRISGAANAIFDLETDHLPPQMTIFNIVFPFLIHFFTVPPLNIYYFASTASASSNVKPDASQTEATFTNDVGFATVYRKIYCGKFLTSSNQALRYIRMCIRIRNTLIVCLM